METKELKTNLLKSMTLLYTFTDEAKEIDIPASSVESVGLTIVDTLNIDEIKIGTVYSGFIYLNLKDLNDNEVDEMMGFMKNNNNSLCCITLNLGVGEYENYGCIYSTPLQSVKEELYLMTFTGVVISSE